MGIFGFGKGNGESKSVGGGLNLDIKKEAELKLDTRKQVLNLCLDKNGLTNVKARVGIAMDYSGSMRDEFRNGLVQDTIERLFPIALNFDDNGELDFWLFENGCRRLESVDRNNFYNYVDDYILSKRYSMGGTEYAPVMRDILKKYIKEEPSDTPTFIIFITDGDNSDKRATDEVIRESANHNIFWQFVGLDSNGYEEFKYLRKLDDLSGRKIDNTSFVKMVDIRKIKDEAVYDSLIGEFPDWLKEAKNKGILR